MIKEKKKLKMTNAIIFIILMGIVSMFSDMTHEGAKSIYGAFLQLLGASPKTISLVSGFGEFIGCSLILLTSYIENITKKFWLFTYVGYIINVLAIPALALSSEKGWIFAMIMILTERVGRAIRKPAKNTLVSFAGADVGAGKAFALQEFLDQLGAFIGPLILTLTLSLKGSLSTYNSYRLCFLILGIPAIITLGFLVFASLKYPHPDLSFEQKPKEEAKEITKSKFKLTKKFGLYLVAISLSAIGFIDYPIITLYINSLQIIKVTYLPLFYSLAMLSDAISALVFGNLFDKYGIKILAVSTIISMMFSLFIFISNSLPMIIIGSILWGVGMGAQESILKSAVTVLVPKDNRAMGFGIFEFAFGIFWFIGSYIIGILYEVSFTWLIIFSCGFEALSIPFYLLSSKKSTKELNKAS